MRILYAVWDVRTIEMYMLKYKVFQNYECHFQIMKNKKKYISIQNTHFPPIR